MRAGLLWNWLHLDLKGVIPSEEKLLRWLDWFAEAGFDGIVWEYEDRLPWRTWTGTFRPGFDLDAWRRIWDHCHRLGLEIVPLIQIHGHLQWLLKHEAYAHLREGEHYDELCPLHEEAMPRVTAWIDEAVALHPESRYLHLGADETWHLGGCPRCRAWTARHPEGRIGLYLHHVRRVCEYAAAKDRTPLIWADMFWREGRLDLARELPPEVILVDWHYDGPGPFATTGGLRRESGRTVVGASAARCGHDPTRPLALYPLGPRIENVLGWHERAEEGAVYGLIHTNWARAHSLSLLYGPWQGWLPAYIAAGRPADWAVHELRSLVAEVDAAMGSGVPEQCDALAKKVLDMAGPDERARETLTWWSLALRHRSLLGQAVRHSMLTGSYLGVRDHVGMDPADARRLTAEGRELEEDLDVLEQEIRSIWRSWELSDEDEYVEGRFAPIRRLLGANTLTSR